MTPLSKSIFGMMLKLLYSYNFLTINKLRIGIKMF